MTVCIVQVSLLVLLLSVAGWVVFVVGMGCRNTRSVLNITRYTDNYHCSYKAELDSATAAPEYFFLWLFMCSGPILYVLSFIQSVWESRIPIFLVNEVVTCCQIVELPSLGIHSCSSLHGVSGGSIVL